MDEHSKATRNTQTRGRLKRALVELIGEKGFDALTVSDVTRRAGVNRGTFYLHFVDKYDMLEKLEDEVIDALREVLLATEDSTPASCLDLFSYEKILSALLIVKGDFDFVAAISGHGGDPEFSSKLKRIIEGLLDQGLKRTDSIVKTDIFPEAYARDLAISHVLAIIRLWLACGGRESPEEVARMVVAAKEVCPCNLVGPR